VTEHLDYDALRADTVRQVAKLMAAPAITAPKSGGQLFLAGKHLFVETVIVDNRDTLSRLAAWMRARGKERREAIWFRDAEAAEAIDAVLFVGLNRWYPPNYDCGACGYATCAEFMRATKQLRVESEELEFVGPSATSATSTSASRSVRQPRPRLSTPSTRAARHASQSRRASSASSKRTSQSRSPSHSPTRQSPSTERCPRSTSTLSNSRTPARSRPALKAPRARAAPVTASIRAILRTNNETTNHRPDVEQLLSTVANLAEEKVHRAGGAFVHRLR